MISDTILRTEEWKRAARPSPGILRLGRLKYVAIIGLLIVIPYLNTLNLILGISIRPLILGLLTLLFLDSLRILARQGQKLYFFEQVALLWIGLAIVYIPITSITTGSVVQGMTAGVFGFLIQFQGFLAYFIIRGMQLSSSQIRRFLKAMLIPLVLMVGYGFYEYVWGQYQLLDWLMEYSRHPFILEGDVGYFRQRYGAVFYRSQSFELEFVSFGYSGYVLSCVLLAVVALSRQVRPRKVLWLALGLSILGLLSSVTLSAVAILLLTFVVVTWEVCRRRGNTKFVMFSLPVLGIIGFMLMWAFSPTVAETIERELSHQQSIAHRLFVHIDGNVDALERTPIHTLILGRGLGTSGPGSRRYFPPQEYDLFIENEYIGNLAEAGAAGLAVYLLLMFSMVRHIKRVKRRYSWGSLGYAVGIGLFCVALGYILIGFSHNVWGQSSIDVQFMMLLALYTLGGEIFEEDKHFTRSLVALEKPTNA